MTSSSSAATEGHRSPSIPEEARDGAGARSCHPKRIDNATERLADEFAGIFSQETIARYMAESTDLLGEAKIKLFVPVLAHRFARERLKALA